MLTVSFAGVVRENSLLPSTGCQHAPSPCHPRVVSSLSTRVKGAAAQGHNERIDDGSASACSGVMAAKPAWLLSRWHELVAGSGVSVLSAKPKKFKLFQELIGEVTTVPHHEVLPIDGIA